MSTPSEYTPMTLSNVSIKKLPRKLYADMKGSFPNGNKSIFVDFEIFTDTSSQSSRGQYVTIASTTTPRFTH